MSKVFLVPISADEPPQRQRLAIDRLWAAAGFDAVLESQDLAALKLHVGEPGTRTFVSPVLAAAIVERMASTGAQPFLTDTAVLYKSRRDNAVSHAQVVVEHGFGAEVVGAPFVPADGLVGTDELNMPVDGTHYREVAIATGIVHARSLIVLTHATGHLVTGLGGALKNLGMGCASKKGKLRMHHGQYPRVDEEACVACGECAQWCPSDAIAVEETAVLDEQVCIGCGECVAVCRVGALAFGWGVVGPELQQRIVEHAAAVVNHRRDRIGYVTVAQNITKDCDCMGKAQPALLPDIGILASKDPVAIDQAVLTLVQQRAGRSLESLSYPQLDATAQIEHGVAMGLGEADVELVTLEI
jgi:uncharacterized protein